MNFTVTRFIEETGIENYFVYFAKYVLIGCSSVVFCCNPKASSWDWQPTGYNRYAVIQALRMTCIFLFCMMPHVFQPIAL